LAFGSEEHLNTYMGLRLEHGHFARRARQLYGHRKAKSAAR
jgi:hypothetical protein